MNYLFFNEIERRIESMRPIGYTILVLGAIVFFAGLGSGTWLLPLIGFAMVIGGESIAQKG